MTTAPAPTFAVLLDRDAPAGALVHDIPHRAGRSASYRTIKATRRDGVVWYCRAVLTYPAKPAEGVAELPDGRHFYASGHVADRDDPSDMRWLMQAVDIIWSKTRDYAFVLGNDVIAAFGPGGQMWRLQLPGADPDAFIGDASHDEFFRCTAQRRDKAPDGEPVYMNYVIAVADGSIREQWADEPLTEETH
jgi:hypothetical protein